MIIQIDSNTTINCNPNKCQVYIYDQFRSVFQIDFIVNISGPNFEIEKSFQNEDNAIAFMQTFIDAGFNF
jgi:hypothetical protein